MNLRRGLQSQPLASFFALAFAGSWACWALASASQAHWPGLATLLMLAGGFGPSVAAVIVVVCTRQVEGLRTWLSHCLQWRLGWGPYAIALLLPLALMSVGAGLHLALGGALGASPASGHLWMTAVNLPLVLLLGGPVGEEFGWRGYALPALQTRLGWRTASLVLGVVWGVWHLPLFAIAGTAQSHVPLAWFLPSVVAMSVVIAWLVNRTGGSVMAALVFHTAVNFWPSVVPVLPTETSHRAYAWVVALLVVLALAALVKGPGPARNATSGRTGPGFHEGP
jgi:membrane protease YdiL (CAAX protease family)